MTMRTRSKVSQRGVWAIATLVALTTYVISVRLFLDCAAGCFWGVEQQRVLLPVLFALGVFLYETRWNGMLKSNASGKPVAEATVPSAEAAAKADAPDEKASPTQSPAPAAEQKGAETSPAPKTRVIVSDPVFVAPQPPAAKVVETPAMVSESGEEEYVQARQIPHQLIPDYSQENDGRYLDLLGKSASRGYPKALSKLGDYAMRREAWVEAYYWMWLARRAGMRNLDPVLKGIRLSWATEGYPNEVENVHRLFSEADGSIGRALLDIDSGRDVTEAKAYLQKNRPDLLD